MRPNYRNPNQYQPKQPYSYGGIPNGIPSIPFGGIPFEGGIGGGKGGPAFPPTYNPGIPPGGIPFEGGMREPYKQPSGLPVEGGNPNGYNQSLAQGLMYPNRRYRGMMPRIYQ